MQYIKLLESIEKGRKSSSSFVIELGTYEAHERLSSKTASVEEGYVNGSVWNHVNFE